MKFFKVFLRKGRSREPKPLRINGVKTMMTPEPDEAEIAAQALLEGGMRQEDTKVPDPSVSPAYYNHLAERIRRNRAAEARLTLRYLSHCEEQLAQGTELYVGQMAEMERGLMKRLDCAEREGGELLKRWRHCVADVTVRLMKIGQVTDETNY